MTNSIGTKIVQLLPTINLSEAQTDDTDYTVYDPEYSEKRNKAGVYAIEANVSFYSVAKTFQTAQTAMDTIKTQIGTYMNDNVYSATITSENKTSVEGLWILQTIYHIIQNT